MKSIKAIFRRGQNPKVDGQNLPDNLSRTSSVTNLGDVEPKVSSKGAKPRKSASRDRIDRIGDVKKNDGPKGVSKNNNKLEGDSPYPSIDSLQEEEFLQLRRQLQEMAQEKSNLALQLGEQKGQLNILQKEIQKLKEESNMQLEHLTEENTALRNRLRDVAHSPLSDNEKQQLLYESHRHHSSAPASIATNQLADESNGGDITACPTPDWDKHSSSNVSEVSVACLQDKINQMQETHYSTNEELQATLQELTDLQRQLTELQQENERLNEEKTLMFDSLCRQTDRLAETRSEVDSLKQLLYRGKDEAGQYESAVEREQKLLDLLKSAQEERETLLVKLEQINSEIQETRANILEKDDRILQLSERVRTLESTLDAKHAEHKQLDQELAQARDQCSARQIEINRLTDLLDNARTKITELEQDRALSDKSELDELLDNARKEKDALESEVAHLKEQLAISKNEIEKLKEQVSVLQEECKVTRNNARTTQSDLEYKCEKLVKEKTALNDQLQEFQEAVNELQVQSQCQLEDKRQLSSVLSETQRNLSESERKNLSLENELQEIKKLRAEENEEWEKFQSDLLTSVRVANDFKTEAQQELQRMILENKSYRDRERQLKAEIDKLKGASGRARKLSSENKENREMDGLLKLSRRSKERNKRVKETPEVAVKVDKSKEKTPDVATKTVKRREKKPTASKKNKTMSVEEELLLKSLNDWYENIDKNTPEDKLTEEEKVVRKLKTLYEDESTKERPIAHKPKDQLAISKPLLDSVFLNPKLEEIAKNPNVPTIEEIGKSDFLSPRHSPELRRAEKVDPRGRVKSHDFGPVPKVKRPSIISRSKSLDDIYILEEKEEKIALYRSNETEDVRNHMEFKREARESSIRPSDSASNPRYSDFTLVLHSQEDLNEPSGTKLARKSSVNYETLESIVSSIPKNAPENFLTNEQKFALRLKKALDEAEKKHTLKRQRRNKKLVISSPLIESVKKNPKLKAILQDPQIKTVGKKRRNSENETKLPTEASMRASKSYQDISFTFEAGSTNRCSTDSVSEASELVSATESFSMEEKSLETGEHFKNIRDSILLPYKRSSRDESDVGTVEDEEFDSLTYNETLKKSGRNSKASEAMKENVDAEDVTVVEENDGHTSSKQSGRNSEENKAQSKDLDAEEEIPALEENIGLISPKKISDKDDLVYNETLNKKLESCVNNDKDLCQQVIQNVPDYHNTLENLHNLSVYQLDNPRYQQPLEIEGGFQEMSINNEVYHDAIDELQEIPAVEEQEVVYIETSNAAVKICIIETYGEEKEKIVELDGEDDFFDTHVPDSSATQTRLNDNFSKYNIDVSADITEDKDKEDEEYNYQDILKENRFGVTSPLNIRLVYKDVVKEIKHKFPQDQVVEEETDDIDNYAEERDTFFDEFFGVKRKTHAQEEPNIKNVDEIDKEMEEIFEKYLHTPVSKVITQIEEPGKTKTITKPEDSKQSELDGKTNDEIDSTKDNIEDEDVKQESDEQVDDPKDDLKERLNTKDDKEVNEQSLEEIMLIIDDHRVLDDGKNNLIEIQDTSLEVVPICEENTDDVVLESTETRHENVEFSEIESTGEYLPNNFTDDVTVTNSIEKHLPDIVESVNQNVAYKFMDEDEIKNEENNSKLTPEERELLSNIRKERFSRPLSEFGEKDLQLIEELASHYLPELMSESVDTKIEEPGRVASSSKFSTQENMDHFDDKDDRNVDEKIEEATKLNNVAEEKSDAKTEEKELKVKQDYTDEDLDAMLARVIAPRAIPRRRKRRTVITEEVKDEVEINIAQTEDSISVEDTKEKEIEQDTQKLVVSKVDEDGTVEDIKETSYSVPTKEDENNDTELKPLKIEKPIEEFVGTETDVSAGFEVPKVFIEQEYSYLKPVEIDESNIFLAKPIIIEDEPVLGIAVVEEEPELFHSSFDDQLRKPGLEPRFQIGRNRIGDIRSSLVAPNVRYSKEEKRILSDTIKRDYKGIKDKLEYFSRNSESPSLTRQSLRSFPGRSGVDTRKVKSWAENFERKSLDTYSYEPVYANFSSLMTARSDSFKTKIDKKPLPVPRSRNQNGLPDDTNHDSSQAVKNDTNVNGMKMSDPKNFSENVAKDIVREVTENVFQEATVEDVGKREEISRNEVPRSMLGAARLVDEDRACRAGGTIGIKKSEKFLDVPSDDDVKNAEDSGRMNYASGAESSFSTIAVAGKLEQLDITKHSDLDLESSDANIQSKLNLFQMESPCYDESYLNLFKQPEDKIYDDITGNKRPQRGFLNITYLGEMSDNDSFDDMIRGKPNTANLDSPKVKPKVIDFVPLDDATKPYYKKNPSTVPDYDTLEREKTFQVLNSAPSDSKSRTKPKTEGSKSSIMGGSSFSQAKKVFEALLEANSEKSAVKPKIPKKIDSVYELTGKLEMRRSSSTMGLTGKMKVEENVEK